MLDPLGEVSLISVLSFTAFARRSKDVMFISILLLVKIYSTFCLKCTINVNGRARFMVEEAWCGVHFYSGSCSPSYATFQAIPRKDMSELAQLGCMYIPEYKECTCFCNTDHCNRNFTLLYNMYAAQKDADKSVLKCLEKHKKKLGDKGRLYASPAIDDPSDPNNKGGKGGKNGTTTDGKNGDKNGKGPDGKNGDKNGKGPDGGNGGKNGTVTDGSNGGKNGTAPDGS
ncbi:hypothetical protein GCK32_011496, partial [Trichostrongylus colubriformis]